MNTGLELRSFEVMCLNCTSDNIELYWQENDFGSGISFNCLDCLIEEDKIWNAETKKWVDS
jgi:nitrate/TMAO reductase-like tetraheme cytochrome c subunit